MIGRAVVRAFGAFRAMSSPARWCWGVGIYLLGMSLTACSFMIDELTPVGVMVAAMLRLFPVLPVVFLVYILCVREVVKFLGAMAKSHQVRLHGSKRRQLRIRYGSVTIAAYLLVFLASERGVSLLLRGIPEWVRVTLWMHVEMPAMLFFVAGFVLLISVWTIPSVSLESESERGAL